MSDPLLELLISCTVRIRGTDTGSGFYITPGLVLTCAHVVGPDRKPGDESLFVEIPDGKTIRQIPARLIALLPDQDDDLALLSVGENGASATWLDDTKLMVGDKLLLYGFPKGVGDTRTAEYEGQSQRAGEVARFHHLFKGGQIIHGFSGGPILNLRTGSVIGIVTETRGQTTDIGGMAIPIGAVREFLRTAADSLIDNSEVQQRWITATKLRAKQIQQTLQSTAGESRHLPAATTIQNFINWYAGDKTSLLFAGRREQLRQLNDWLCIDERPYALIAAPAGRGKSTLLVRWLEDMAVPDGPIQTGSTRVVFVPISVRFGLNTEEAVFRALVARLENIYGDDSIEAKSTYDLRDRFSELLSKERESSPKILIVIDGLDEAAGWEIGAGLFPATAAAGIKVLVTARTQADRNPEQWLEALGWTEQLNCRRFHLPSLTTTDIADLIRMLGLPLATLATDEAFVNRMHALSDGGDPLVLSLLLEDLRNDPKALDHLKDKGRPSGLERYFDQWWKQQEQLWGGPLARIGVDTRNVFNLLATAFGPLERTNLLRFARRLRAECSGDDLNDALHQLRRFVLYEPANEEYVLAHPRFAEYRYEKLRRDHEEHQYESLFLEWGRDTLKAWTDLLPPVDDAKDRYIVRYYGAHLKRSGRPVEEFIARVNRGWEAAWNAFGDDYNGYFLDVGQSLEAARNYDRVAFKENRLLPFFGEQWRCAYALADRKSVAESLKPSMLGSLLKHHVWSGRRCLTFIQQLDEYPAQAEALGSVIPHLPVPLLSEAERQLRLIKVGRFQETIAPALVEYCIRLWDLSRDEALQYAYDWKRGVARSEALVSLGARMEDRAERSKTIAEAFQLEGFDWLETSRLVDRLRFEFARFSKEPGSSDDDDKWITAGLNEEARIEILNRVTEFIRKNKEARWGTSESGFLDDYGQNLELVLPWISRAQARAVLAQYFELVKTGDEWFKRYAADVFKDIAINVDNSELLANAVEAAESLKDLDYDGDIETARALLALVPAMSQSEQSQMIPQLLEVAVDLSEFSSISERCEFVVGLVKLGMGNQVLEFIRKTDENEKPWDYELLEAILPYLDKEQTMACVAESFFGKEAETWRKALPAIWARIAEFGPREVRYALENVQLGSQYHPQPLVSSALKLYVDADPERSDFLTFLREALSSPNLTSLEQHAVSLAGERAAVPITSSDLLEITKDLPIDPSSAGALALLAPYLSRDAVLDPNVQSLYRNLVRKIGYANDGGSVYEFCSRMVQVVEKDAAIKFGLTLPKIDGSGWVIPPEAIRAIPQLSSELVERQQQIATRLEDPFQKCIALAAIAEYIGDEPWTLAWREISDSISQPYLLDNAFRIRRVLEILPKQKADSAFSASFAERFKQKAWWHKSFDAQRVLGDLGRYYPADWFNDIEPLYVRSDSGTDRSHAMGTIAIRLAEIGRASDALFWLQEMSYADPEMVAEAFAYVPVPEMPDWFKWMLADLPRHDNYASIWKTLYGRWCEMDKRQTLDLCELWLDMVAKRPRRSALMELLGFIPAFESLGGTKALIQIEAALREL